MYFFRSPPQQKSFSPTAVRTPTLISSSLRISSHESIRAENDSAMRVFAFSGRFSVIQATCPRFSKSTTATALFAELPIGGHEYCARIRSHGVGPYSDFSVLDLALSALAAAQLANRLDTKVGAMSTSDIARPPIGVDGQLSTETRGPRLAQFPG